MLIISTRKIWKMATSQKNNYSERYKIAQRNLAKAKRMLKRTGKSFLVQLSGGDEVAPDLTRAEQVFGYMLYESDLSISQIAMDLGVSVQSTKNTKVSLNKKLGLSSLEEL